MTPMRLACDLVDFLESGVAVLVGTRDGKLKPACLRAMGARVDRGLFTLTLYVPQATAGRTLANLEDNGRIAVTFSRPVDHRSIQVKGECVEIRESEEGDREVQERYRIAYFEVLEALGLPRGSLRRIVWWPSVAVTMRIERLFEQTPGPSAGRSLDV